MTNWRSKQSKVEGVLRLTKKCRHIVEESRSEMLYLRVKNLDIVLTERIHFNRNEKRDVKIFPVILCNVKKLRSRNINTSKIKTLVFRCSWFQYMDDSMAN